MVRPPWSTKEEESKLVACVSKNGKGKRVAIPTKAGFKRCGNGCKMRWTNDQRHDPKNESLSFTTQEEEMIVRLHAAIGSRWTIIAQQLPGKTDVEVKNYWNTTLRKKLSNMGIDPVTHKPFSQLIVDYGNLGGLMTRSPPPSSSTLPGLKSRNMDLKCTNNTSNLQKLEATQDSICLLDQLQTIKLVKKSTKYGTCLSSCSNSFSVAQNNSHWCKQEQRIETNEGLGLQDQLQTVHLVTKNMDHDVSVASCSSSISSVGPAEGSESPSWREFLLEDLFSSQNENQPLEEERTIVEHSTLAPEPHCQNPEMNRTTTNSSCSSSSFVDSIVKCEDEMFLDAPLLLEESF